MEFKDNIPIYFQIEQYLYRQIVMGKIKAGEKIPSVRNFILNVEKVILLLKIQNY